MKSVIVVQRTKQESTIDDRTRLLAAREVRQVSAVCPAEPLDSEHPLFILYTSGTTGKPKGILAHDGGLPARLLT